MQSSGGSASKGSALKMKIAILGAGILLIVGIVLVNVFPSASNQGYAPEQPIPFNHKKHAGLYKMDCQYCHTSVEKSYHATVPALNVCMNCHSVVKTDSPFIQKIKKAYDEGKPIEWVRIHELPDHVHFPHKRHVAAGVKCETCHGDVKNMERVYQFGELTMGWCLKCHRGQNTPDYLLKQYHPDPNDKERAVAPINCSACHY